MTINTAVWITGASGGLGAALAATVPHADATVYNVSRSPGADTTIHVPADLSDPASWASLGQHFAEVLGSGDVHRAICIHNAGTLDPMGFAGQVDQAGYTANVLLNAAAPQVIGSAFIKAVTEAGIDEAAYAIPSSGAATKPYEGWSSYCGAKAGVDHWVRTVGAEQARTANPVKVLAIAPGVVDTGMQDYIRAQDVDAFPAKEKFVGLFERGELTDPMDSARGFWHVIGDGEFETGAVVDLRHI